MAAFPGFGYIEGLNLDVRDSDFWMTEAQKKMIGDRIDRIEDMRIAQADSASYQRIMSDLRSELSRLEGFKEVDKVHQKAVWDELKRKGKG